jgi:hypothetical protein
MYVAKMLVQGSRLYVYIVGFTRNEGIEEARED